MNPTQFSMEDMLIIAGIVWWVIVTDRLLFGKGVKL